MQFDDTKDFTLLISGLSDNDRLVRELQGGKFIYYKSQYVPPYEKFEELRNLILRVKESDDINAENRIAVDLSEWVGHESEEFFEVMMKYFHDQRKKWNYIFTVADYTETKVLPLFLKASCYMSGTITEDRTFRDCDKLQSYISSKIWISAQASACLAKLLLNPKAAPIKGFERTDMILDEIERWCGGSRVTMKELKQYAEEKYSVLYLLYQGDFSRIMEETEVQKEYEL